MERFERELKRGTLEMVLLHLLRQGPSYGYEMVARLRAGSTDFELKEGTLYPVLYRLESAGWIEPEWRHRERGVPRKYYRLTPEGEERSRELVAAWRSFSSSVDELLGEVAVDSE